MRDEIEAIDKADLPTSLLSFDATVELIKFVRNHVSVCKPLSADYCRNNFIQRSG